MTDKFTLDDVRQMFGGTIPKAALNIICAAPDSATLDDLRPDLEALAATAYVESKTRKFRVLFGNELNGE